MANVEIKNGSGCLYFSTDYEELGKEVSFDLRDPKVLEFLFEIISKIFELLKEQAEERIE